MRYGTMACVIGLVLVTMMAAPSMATMTYTIPVAPEGDRVWVWDKSSGYVYTYWINDANPNEVSHYYDYDFRAGVYKDAYLTFALTSISGKGSVVSSATFNFYIENIWTSGRNDVGNFSAGGTVYASGGTGWKYFDVTTPIVNALNSSSTTADFNIIHTGDSGFTFSSAEGGLRPAYLSVTTTEANPIPVPPSAFLLAPGLVGVAAAAVRRKTKR